MIALLFLLLVGILFAELALGSWVIVMNVNDMLANGVNFWNVFWVLLVVVILTGTSTQTRVSS